jgi:hypothetical protein
MEPHDVSATEEVILVDESSSEDGYSSVTEELDPQVDEVRPCVHSTGLGKDYRPYWTRRDAFREFYQNW